MEKGPSCDEPYIILIRNYEFCRPSVLKILVSVACVIRTFYLHPLDLIELRLTDEKKYLYLIILNSKSKITYRMEKGSSFDEPYIMKKNIIKFCYVYIIFHLPYMNFRMELKCN
ncbi:hypothetical protein [Gemella sp.]